MSKALRLSLRSRFWGFALSELLVVIGIPVWAAASHLSAAESIAQASASRPLNDRMGVATHFCHKEAWMNPWDAERYIPMIADLGVGWIRDEIPWPEIEPEAGRYVLPEKVVQWVDLANAHGLKIIACFSDPNPAYANPFDPDAYAKAAAWLAARLDGKIQAMEIVNEPFNGYAAAYGEGHRKGGTWYGKEKDGAVSPWIPRYHKLLNAAADAIKAANPRMTVVGLGCCMPENYYLLERGISRNVDAITDHPYSFHSPPEIIPHAASPSYLARVGFPVADKDGTFASYLRMCLEKSRACHGPSRFWATEFGWSTCREGITSRVTSYAGFNETAQARYAQRRFVEGMALGVEVDIFYDFLDDSGQAGGRKGDPAIPEDPFDPEQHFGLLRKGGVPKPSYAAVRNVARATAGFTPGNPVDIRITPFSDRLGENPPAGVSMEILPALRRVMRYPFTDAKGRPVFALWSAERPNDLNVRAANVELDADPSKFTVEATDLMTGEVFTPETQNHGGRLLLEKFGVPDYPMLLRLVPVGQAAGNNLP